MGITLTLTMAVEGFQEPGDRRHKTGGRAGGRRSKCLRRLWLEGLGVCENRSGVGSCRTRPLATQNWWFARPAPHFICIGHRKTRRQNASFMHFWGEKRVVSMAERVGWMVRDASRWSALAHRPARGCSPRIRQTRGRHDEGRGSASAIPGLLFGQACPSSSQAAVFCANATG